MHRVIHFEIHADDPKRAAKFYRDVFGWDILGREDQPYWLITTGTTGTVGINGGIMKRRGPSPVDGAAVNSYVSIIQVPSADEYTKKITVAGGINVVPKITLPGLGYSAYFKDTEKNIFGIFQNDSQAK